MAMSSLGRVLPEYSEIVNALAPLADKFFELGIQLKIEYKQLKAIKNDNNGNQSLCLHDTINLWQQNNTSGECSWSTLAEAVEKVGGHNNLVSELKKRDTKPQVLHYPPEPTERANEGCISVSDSTLQRCNSRPSGSEDESGYSSKSDSVQSGDSSGSEAECFELGPGCGCTDKKPCSLYALCAGECPNPTVRKRVPILRKKSKAGAMSSQTELPVEEEHDFEDYEERTKEIQKSFGSFVCKTSHHFKISNLNIRELILYIQGAYPVMKPRMEELSKVTHFEDFFRIIIDQACSWFDYGIIKDLILRFCTSAKSCLDQYEACFKEYAEQRLPKGMKHIEIGGGARRGGKQLVIKIDREWEEVTFNDLKKLRGTFASILGPGVRRSDLYLADIREGCIMMTFMITEELAGRLFPSKTCLTSSQVKSLKDERVLSVKCGSLSWQAVVSNNKCDVASCRPETRAKVVPQNSPGWRLKIFDIRAMMVVMFLLALVFTVFGGLLLLMQATQINSDHAQVAILHKQAPRFNINLIQADLILVLLTDFKWITDDLEDVEFTITYQRDAEIIKESEFHFEFYVVTDNRFTHEDGEMRIEQKDKVKLKRDDLTPKIAEPIQVVYEGIVASMVVIAIFMIIVILVVILVTAVIIKRQNDYNKRQQRQLESMRRLQFSNGKLSSMSSPQRVSGTHTNTSPEAVIGNLLPKRNNYNTSIRPKPPQHIIPHIQQEEERSGHGKHRFHFHRNSSGSMKRLSMNVANTNVYMEEPEVYQLPPKPQPRRKISTPDSPLLKKLSLSSQKPPAPPPPGAADEVVVEIIKEDLSKKPLGGGEEAMPPPRPPKKSMSSLDTGSRTLDTGSLAGEQSPLAGRKPSKPNRSNQSNLRGKSCERGVHFDPKEEEPPPLPPRSAVTMEGIPTVHVVVPSQATSMSVGTAHKGKYPPVSSEVITVQATMEDGQREGAGSTPPPNYSVVMEMEPHSSERSSRDGSHDALSDCTASTELKIGKRGEGGVRYGSPESCESTC